LVSLRKASEDDIRALSKKLLTMLENKDQFYRDNVTKFGIPENYVRDAFSADVLLGPVREGVSRIYLALEGNEILGFAQTIERGSGNVELDRIVVFPDHSGKGIGTQLLGEVLADQKQEGIRTITVNAGQDETHARRFYEKNGFVKVNQFTIDAPWGRKLNLVTYQLDL